MQKVTIIQEIERTGDAEFTITMKVEGNEYTEQYTQTNAIFPAYKSLIFVLRDYKDIKVEVQTNAKQMASELKNESNKNTTLLNIYRDIVARNGLEVVVNG